MVAISAEIRGCVGSVQRTKITMWLADVGHPIVPLSGLITHREKAYGVQAVIAAPVKSMFFGRL
jgi:hypothetical protein